MSRADGSIRIDTKIDTKNANKEISTLGSTVKKLGGVIAAAFAITKIVQFGKSAISLASDLEEVQNVVNVAFGSMANKADEFAKSALKSYGLSELSAKKYSSTFMSMAKSMGLSVDDATNMSLALTGLVGDVASFYNLETDAAYSKLKGVFTGETEALKDLGVVMTEANLKAFALEKGIKADYNAMSQAEKTALRYQYVTEKLSLAQGDFARTSDNWANQTRVLKETFNSLSSIIGEFLIKGLTPFVQKLNELLQGLLDVAQAARGLGVITDATEDLGDTATDAAGAQEEVTAAVEETGEAIAGNLSSFDELNIMNAESGESVGDGASVFDGLPTDESTSVEVGEGSTISPDLTDTATGVKALIEPIIDAVLKMIVSLAGAIGKALPTIIDAAVGIVFAITDAIVKNLPSIVLVALQIVQSLAEGILQALPHIIDGITNLLALLIETIVENLPDIVQAGVEVVLALVEGIVDALPHIIESVLTLIITLIETIVENLPEIIAAGMEIVGSLVGGLLQAIPHLIAAVPQLIAAIIKTIFSTNWLQVGVDIIKGIGEGLIDGVKAIGSKIGDACKSIWGTVKGWFGISSPSKKMRTTIGPHIATGVGVGFEDEIGNVGDDMESALADEFDDAWGRVAVDLDAAKLPSVSVNEMLPVEVSHELIKGEDDTLGDIRDSVENIENDVKEMRKNGENPTTSIGDGALTTRGDKSVSATRENRKAGKTIYPVGV